MKPMTEYLSADGILRLIVTHDDGGVALGFAGYSWHIHAEILVELWETTERHAIDRFVSEVLADRTLIAVCRVGSTVQDVWITDDPPKELRYRQDGEEIEFRYWSGRTLPVSGHR
jgi:hypothetical protein